MDTKYNKELDSGEINILEYINFLWSKRITLVLFTSMFALLSVLYSLSLDNYYSSETILSVEQEVQSDFGQLSGLGSIAGFNLSSSPRDKSSEAIQIIQSRTFLKHLLTFQDILPSLMAVKSFNEGTSSLEFNENIFDFKKNEWLENDAFKNNKPSYLEAYKAYSDAIKISKLKNGFVSLKVEHLSPFFAKSFLDLIVKEVNSIMREEDLKKAIQAREYLQNQLEENKQLQVKSAISSLIELNIKKEVTAKLNEYYVLKPLDKAFVPEQKSRPSRALICILGTTLGFLLTAIFILIRRTI